MSRYLLINNIKQINIESIEELQLVDTIANSLNKKPRVGLRINPDINAKTLDKILGAGFKSIDLDLEP